MNNMNKRKSTGKPCTCVATHPASVEQYDKYVDDNKDAFIKKWFADAKTPYRIGKMSFSYAGNEEDDGSLEYLKVTMDISRGGRWTYRKKETLETVIDGCDFIAWYDNGRNKVPEDVSDDEYNGLWQWKDGRMVRADHIRRIK